MIKPAVKAYQNLEFLRSHDARTIRVLCELTEPKSRLHKYNVENTIVFFGSARIKSKTIAEKNLLKIQKLCEAKKNPGKKLLVNLRSAKTDQYMSQYYEKARSLSCKLTHWAKQTTKNKSRLLMCTGGGGGIMGAVNQGASEAGGRSIGFNISLPFEQVINKYITEELSFEFHYFFIRKFWFAYMAKALIVFPGGFGTLDEMTEILTLIQTGKVQKKLPVILFGTDYWKKVINFEEMIKYNTISRKDLKLFHFFDDVDEAFEFLKKELKDYI
ncbi:MAG: TIGR00730 family Rossman fold protein [bacterium]|nr:TIGR00730 family Rossman fold protein [bacterium]